MFMELYSYSILPIILFLYSKIIASILENRYSIPRTRIRMNKTSYRFISTKIKIKVNTISQFSY